MMKQVTWIYYYIKWIAQEKTNMVKVLMSRDFWEHIMFDYKDYTVADFEISGKIDMESYFFFKTLINSKAKLFLNITPEKILEFRTADGIIHVDDRNLSQLIRNYGSNTLKSDDKLFKCLEQQKIHDIKLEELPVFLLLGDVDKKICLEIEKMYGINCFSKQRLIVPTNYRQVQLLKLSNTKSGLFEKLNKYNYNSLQIEDPWFIEQHFPSQGKYPKVPQLGYFETIARAGIKKLKVLINYQSKNNNDAWCLEKMKIVKNFIEQKGDDEGIVCEVLHERKVIHDRYLNTNTTIGILGNSLNTSTPTHFTIYPLCIYSGFFDK